VAGGSYAEYVIVHHRTAAKIPDNLSFEQAAAVPEAYTTAYDAMVCQGNLSAGDCVLISAVGSGVGTAALQIARAIGATSIGLSRTSEKITRAIKLGLDFGIVVKDGDYCKKVLELTDGKGVDLVLELLGGDYVLQDLECVSNQGGIILVGLLAGAKVDFNLGQLLRKRITIKGTTLRARPLEEKIEAGSLLAKRIASLLETGRLYPVVDRIFSLWDVADAHRYMESNENFGKIILKIER
ncbi:MAG: zinc-binding dehydrogenase, partial [Candidatus Obscuribacterales bacterium]|nr:zinc-binding dehydrogenase [Candidatus Obscuribacterales bacterium]